MAGGLGTLLFSPSGRIGRDAFRLGAVVLLIANVVMWMGWKVGLGLGTIAMLIAFASIYCWACLYIKRFHDAGKSGWLFLPTLLGFGVLSYILGSILLAIVAPDLVMELQEFQQTANPYDPDLEVALPLYRRAFSTLSLPFAVAYLLVGGAFAFGLNANLRPDPNDNRYGPASR